MGCKIKIPKIYIEKMNSKGEVVLTEFPKGIDGKKMWDKLLLSKDKKNIKIKKMKGGRI